MRFASWGFVAACGFLLAGPVAKAAEIRIPDLPSPQYNWTGFYAGVYGGGAYAAWASDYCRNGACRHAEGQASGFAVGVTVMNGAILNLNGTAVAFIGFGRFPQY